MTQPITKIWGIKWGKQPTVFRGCSWIFGFFSIICLIKTKEPYLVYSFPVTCTLNQLYINPKKKPYRLYIRALRLYIYIYIYIFFLSLRQSIENKYVSRQ